jgi:hypothetical protein
MPLSDRLIVKTIRRKFKSLKTNSLAVLTPLIRTVVKNYAKNWCTEVNQGIPIPLQISTALKVFETKFDALNEDLYFSRDKIVHCNEVQSLLEVNLVVHCS